MRYQKGKPKARGVKSMFGLSKDKAAELSVGKVIGVVILVIIGLLMLPLVQDSVTSAEENATSASSEALLGMITIFYILGIVLAAVLWVVHEARDIQ